MRNACLAALCLLLPLAAAAKPVLLPLDEVEAARQITPEYLRAQVRFLSSDLLEGRGPATRGDELAQSYIAAQMEALGLKPGAPDGSWLQKFDIVGIRSLPPPTVSFEGKDDTLRLKSLEEFVAFSGVQQQIAEVKDAELVFVGYGIQAPEYQWDDYKDLDVKGKILVMMNNDPESSPDLFAGNRRLYYGRWTYKYEIAAKLGAAGAIIIHTDHSAGYKWQVVQSSWSGEGFSLPEAGEPLIWIKAWATEDASRRLFKLGGFDLDALRAQAESRDFKPVPLNVKLSLKLNNEVSRRPTANVIGVLPGRAPNMGKEAVIYTAHHDHLGMRGEAAEGVDNIYNGALDNASGVAALLGIARATVALPKAPRRSTYFAAVAAEEQGLLGSQYLAANPPVAPGLIAANINMDGIAIWGRTRDITLIGKGKSSLDGVIEKVAKVQGRKVEPDQFPDKGSFYRSDQFNFAKIGVPAAYFNAGTDVIGQPPGWGREQRQLFTDQHYHQPSDELRDDWDFSGGVEDARLIFHVGVAVADEPNAPTWNKGDEFEAPRKRALDALKTKPAK